MQLLHNAVHVELGELESTSVHALLLDPDHLARVGLQHVFSYLIDWERSYLFNPDDMDTIRHATLALFKGSLNIKRHLA